MVTILILIGSILLLPSHLAAQDQDDGSKPAYVHRLGDDIQLIVENAFMLVDQHHRIRVGSATREQTSQGWNYRVHGELGVFRRAIIHATVMPTFAERPALVKIGAGMRFTAPWAQETAHPYYGFISTLSVQYMSLRTKDDQGGNLLLEGLAVAVERKQWKLGKFLTLDAGGSLLPWVRLKRESGAERRTLLQNPYLSFAVGVGVELHQYSTIIFNAEEITPLRRLDERLALSFVSVTIRTLL